MSAKFQLYTKNFIHFFKHKTLIASLSVIVAGLFIALIGVAATKSNAVELSVSKTAPSAAKKDGQPKVEGASTTAQAPAVDDQTSTATGTPAPAANNSSAPSKAKVSQPTPAPASTPKPTSFETKITRNGQVAPGTLISYNANKGEKAYYGGDLILSAYNFTISKSGPINRDITVTVPDGQTVGMPSKWWGDQSPLGISMDASKYKSTGVSFQMLLQPYGGLAEGTYQLHIHTARTGQAADAWYYDAFISVTIVP